MNLKALVVQLVVAITKKGSHDYFLKATHTFSFEDQTING